MRIVVLGAAAGGGVPQWNCNCAVCRRARAGDPAAPPRTQSSIAVSADGGEPWFLFNASPDIRRQIELTRVLHPTHGRRHSPIGGVVLTNADVDHVAGLLSLREKQPLTIHATPRVLDVLAANAIFGVLDNTMVRRTPLALDADTLLATADGRAAGLSIRLFPVPGKVALYLENASAGPDFGTRPEDTVGVEIRAAGTNRSLFYIPGCAAVPDDLCRRLDGASLVLFDGTVWTDDEMPAHGVGSKTGQRMGHMCMSGPTGSIAALRGVAIDRRVFVHINNTNPVLLADSAERAEAEAAGWEIAEDGMEISL